MRALITGAASGFGRALARRWAALGVDVLATDRDLEALLTAHPDLPTARLDVTVPADIAAAVAWAGDVDVLVHSAGYAVFGTQAEADLDAVRAMFETNVLGMMAVQQAFLPGLLRRRGAAVILSSAAGRIVFAESGFYAATKHATEAFAEALFLENAHLGLRVIVIEPGNFATAFQDHARAHSRPRDPSSAYADRHAVWDAAREAMLAPPQSPELVVDGILAGLADGRPFVRVAPGTDAPALLAQRAALGDDAFVAWMAERFVGPAVPTDAS
jgi:NADP-dependent 3-hydroxy acid dehydrogenase YdfG